MQTTTMLPTNYRQQNTLDLSKSKKATIAAIVLGIVLLIGVSWFLVQFTHFIRSNALEGLGFHDILTITPNGELSFDLPIVAIIGIVVVLVLVMLIHELVHGVFFWWFGGQRPTFGIKGLFIYVAAPPDIYFPRNPYLVIGIAPLVLLTFVGLLLMVIVPVVALPVLGFSIALNAAGAAGDLVMAVRLLSFSPDTLMQDNDTGVVVYGPEQNGSAA